MPQAQEVDKWIFPEDITIKVQMMNDSKAEQSMNGCDLENIENFSDAQASEAHFYQDTFPILTKLLSTYIESQTFRQYIVQYFEPIETVRMTTVLKLSYDVVFNQEPYKFNFGNF